MFKFALGTKVKDKITGYKGIIVSQTVYMTGCNRYGVQSQKLGNTGKPQDWVFIDEDQLVSCGKIISLNRQQSGGPATFEAPQR